MDLVQLDNPGSSIPLYISPQVEDLLGYPRDAWLTDDELWLDVLRERAEEALAASERQFGSVFDAVAIGVMTLDLEGRIVGATRTLEQVGDHPAGVLHA